MPKVHGKTAYLALDDLDGALAAFHSKLESISHNLTADRPATTTYGQRGERHELLGLRDGKFSASGFLIPASASTTKVHGKKTRILLDEFSISSMLDTSGVNRSVGIPQTETYGDDWRERELKGLLAASFSFSGPYAGATGEIDAILKARFAQETPCVISLAPNGFTIGNLVDMGYLAPTDKGITPPLNDKTSVSLTAPCDGEADLGVSLHDLTAETGVVNSASVDETEATADGGVAHLHVTAFTGTNATLKVQHSTDDSVWVDLVTFTVVTGVTKQRSELAAGTAVNRYVRSIISAVTALTSITYAVVFARRTYSYGSVGTHRHMVGLLPRDATTTFEFGPEGNAAGKPKITGECVLASYNTTYPLNDAAKFQAEFMTSGAVSDSTTF